MECEDEIGRVIDVVSPDCKVYTQFPFDDLTESPKDITCTATITLKNSSINDTGNTILVENFSAYTRALKLTPGTEDRTF